uniref:Uncharacterized protein n=1 Tax=Pseudo-nitzschia australis TaxID=44445 RepID=A0A7S4AXU6_9STRA|mmetsp:Transcript_256/g.647  ORF Transcript_256/g.647 Transcript_256/m.647 type:complete len:672 (-) Transcript_256:305-2320(-)|eukprot:CAMPEP_0168188176 /NCGR_PEP_ID=MMETSP0139_2-20121125/15485_1 /TAXON_ID=44445 /ORGANISM="Pseudo-nitzschia australis, Strain 10249 10 AB" /LENGTH=671 /DNA_ID=CAMNT_0008110551 /DNA_START=169 /DNA_END=2184 /DNA_ORIENTATION=-
MPSSGRRSEELQKKLQMRNSFLKPGDFAKDSTLLDRTRKSTDPLEKSKASLSDLRKRIEERKKAAKLINVQKYREGREEHIPELAVTRSYESPALEREQALPKENTLAHTIMMSVQKQKQAQIEGNIPMKNHLQQKNPSRGLKNHYADPCRYRRDMIGEEERRAPPSQIEVRSNIVPDNDDQTEVSEITTDIRIMSTKGAAYAERRMAGKLQQRLMKPSLSGPPGRYLEKDVKIDVSNLRHLGKAVEKAKMELKQEVTSTDFLTRRHGLPYEPTDYRASVDEDEGDSWGDAIRISSHERSNIADPNARNNVSLKGPLTAKKEHEDHLITKKVPARKLQDLVKEAYSYEGDVFIDATEIREEDIDDIAHDLTEEAHDLSEKDNCPEAPINIKDAAADPSIVVEDERIPFVVEKDERIPLVVEKEKPTMIEPSKLSTNSGQQSQDKVDKKESSPLTPIESAKQRNEDSGSSISSGEEKALDDDVIPNNDVILHDDTSLDYLEKESNTTKNPSSIASDFYKSSVGFLKSFSNQVATQIKAIQERGLISKIDMDRMLGVLQHDVDETETIIPEDGDDMVIMLGDELEATACGTGLEAVDDNEEKGNWSNPDPVEKMLESLKKSYNSSISKCGLDSDLIKDNTKTIEEIVANLKKAKGGSSDGSQKDESERVATKA